MVQFNLCFPRTRRRRRGDREHELIEDPYITDDEIGQIMQSRNQTVTQLRQTLDQLEAQDRLANPGLLSASVAHEMNTPLAVLHGVNRETPRDHTGRNRSGPAAPHLTCHRAVTEDQRRIG